MGIGSRVIVLKGEPFPVSTVSCAAGAWKLVGTQVLGSDASSVTFSSLKGDTAVCYYLVISAKADTTAGGTGIIKILPNNDTTNVYGYQRLTGTSTTVGAARATPSCFYGGATGTASYYSHSTTYIYAKQGQLRPAYTVNGQDITGTTTTATWVLGQSYNVTNTEITSLVISTTTNNFKTGSTFSLYALYM
jgi:hypothetical protein